MTERPRPPAGLVRQLSASFPTTRALLAKVVRFVGVGVMNGLLFWFATTTLMERLAVPPVAAAAAGYAVCIPLSFLGHRQFSFRSVGDHRTEAVRFTAVQIANILATALIMYVTVHVYRGAYIWAIGWTIILAPAINFIVANIWIFQRQKGRVGG